MVILSGNFPQHCDSQIHRYCCQWLPLVATSAGRRSVGWANACRTKGINVDFACQPCRRAKEDHIIPSSGTKGEAWLLPISLSRSQAEESGMQALEPLALAPEQRLRGRGWQKLSRVSHRRGFSGCPSLTSPSSREATLSSYLQSSYPPQRLLTRVIPGHIFVSF